MGQGTSGYSLLVALGHVIFEGTHVLMAIGLDLQTLSVWKIKVFSTKPPTS